MGVITPEIESHELICGNEAEERRPSSNQGLPQESPHGTQHVQGFSYMSTHMYEVYVQGSEE